MASVVDQLWPLFHKDPVAYFPAEIVSLIFSYLEPRNLMDASRASRTWRARVLDSRLWKEKFKTEGWGLDMEEVEKYEQQYNLPKTGALGVPRRSASQEHSIPRQYTHNVSKIGNSHLPNHELLPDTPTYNAAACKGPSPEPSEDEEMPDASFEPSTFVPATPLQSMDSESPRDPASTFMKSSPNYYTGTRPGQGAYQEESLMLYASPGHSRLNYHYIFKQKRKLEENWNAGHYRSFQLPHRDHPEDAHTECVYTIQYLGRHLVSGSRDRTLRIWNLDTLRLAKPPLHGHLGSVLCLQFDDQKEEDIIISGSSDCHVIIWRFSTGQKLKQLNHAHKESVLNLRFDKRFLVTCSKDKTIKLWNRRDLVPGDRDYPVKGVKGGGQCPLYIIDSIGVPDALKYGPSKPEHRMRLESYTHIMTLDLHVAAVNAIQIYEDQLVSASGDRCLRVWNIHTGECTTKIEAHQKGIACVQYDGKRIVSGSSDNTIRIWDPISKVEVARLEGHNRLVRTIQAAFVDVPGGRERLGAEAADIERHYHLAQEAGQIPERSRRDPPGRPGSRKPKDLRAINAKIPPSGGGSRWSHIVSGSYDETVIIWKKTRDDEWVIGHRLRQEEALTAAGPELVPRSEQIHVNRAVNNQIGPHRQVGAGTPANASANAMGVIGPLPTHQHHISAQSAANTRSEQDLNNLPAIPSGGWGSSSAGSERLLQPTSPSHNHSNGPPPFLHPNEIDHSMPRLTTIATGQINPVHSAWQNTNANQAAIPQAQANHPMTRPNPNHGPQQNIQAGGMLNPGAVAQANGGANLGGQPNARVFKLQFDARRIICCSQDPKIVGWDFANDDPQIAECSRFFTAPQ